MNMKLISILDTEVQYLDTRIFPTLLPILKNVIFAAEIMECLKVKNYDILKIILNVNILITEHQRFERKQFRLSLNLYKKLI